MRTVAERTIYNFEALDNEFGVAYGLTKLHELCPDAYQVKGQSVYKTIRHGRVMVTCRRIVSMR